MSWLSKITGGSAKDAGGKQGQRAVTPPKISIDHHEYTPEEFVIGSFRIRPYEGDLIAKQQFDFRIIFTLGDEEVEFLCRGLLVKCDGQAGLVARYSRPGAVQERKLVEYLRGGK